MGESDETSSFFLLFCAQIHVFRCLTMIHNIHMSKNLSLLTWQWTVVDITNFIQKLRVSFLNYLKRRKRQLTLFFAVSIDFLLYFFKATSSRKVCAKNKFCQIIWVTFFTLWFHEFFNGFSLLLNSKILYKFFCQNITGSPQNSYVHGFIFSFFIYLTQEWFRIYFRNQTG